MRSPARSPTVNRHVDGLVQLALLRALQGVGTGGLWSMVIAILGDMFGPRKRSEYISYMLSGFGAALVAVMGSLFNQFLDSRLTNALGSDAGRYTGVARNVGAIRSIANPEVKQAVIGALSGSLTSMFFWTLPVIAAGFLLAFALPNPEMGDDPGPENPSQETVPTDDD